MTEIFTGGKERRAELLGRVRQALGVQGEDAARKAVVRGRLENRPRGPIPKHGQVAMFKKVELFAERARKVSASVARVKNKQEILPAVTSFLREHQLPHEVVHGADPYLASLNWRNFRTLKTRQGAPQSDDSCSLVHAFGAAAETGTLVMVSGPDNPVTLNYLPDNAIAVIQARNIAGDYESVLQRIREAYGEGAMPRTVNMITGPSRTADIVQVLLLGVHGPRRLHIIIVG